MSGAFRNKGSAVCKSNGIRADQAEVGSFVDLHIRFTLGVNQTQERLRERFVEVADQSVKRFECGRGEHFADCIGASK